MKEIDGWFKIRKINYLLKSFIIRVWAKLRHCTNPTLQLKLSLKKTAKGTICSLHNLGKKLERKHTRRDLVQYRNCKLNRTWKVHFMARLKFILKSRFSHALLNTYIPCSTKHGERTWQSLTYHIKTCSNIRKLFHSKSKPEWIREKWYRRRRAY